ncbi:hypothetical protein Alvin_2025 [Allochromatium vinosum DSM 180]|uniref:Uncharacterized protein n=1 Tax=Allochromatium vinosum (strain ATCC 17899 / DSM 180 / NBRC 103801 / NCIMB 10441 / D) TaxID=572477 RepID=D3RV17_ALLVD|nr:hypothetical protein Alvin_2025 [Allochromatium vinosum DSM 180]
MLVMALLAKALLAYRPLGLRFPRLFSFVHPLIPSRRTSQDSRFGAALMPALFRQPTLSVWTVISGGQLSRALTTEVPAPTEV